VIWLLFDSVCQYQPSDWLVRLDSCTNQVIGCADRLWNDL